MTLKCVAKLGLSSCCHPSVFWWTVDHRFFKHCSLFRGWKYNVIYISRLPVDRLVLMLLLKFKIFNNEAFPNSAKGSSHPATHCVCSAWVDRFFLDELRASVCFTPGSHLIPNAFVLLSWVELCTKTQTADAYWANLLRCVCQVLKH